MAVPEGWAAAPGVVIVREKHEKKSNTRDEIDERLETEQVHHLGQITSQVSRPFTFVVLLLLFSYSVSNWVSARAYSGISRSSASGAESFTE